MFADIKQTCTFWSMAMTLDATAAQGAWFAKLIDEGLDIVSGRREATGAAAYRRGLVLGNRLLNRPYQPVVR